MFACTAPASSVASLRTPMCSAVADSPRAHRREIFQLAFADQAAAGDAGIGGRGQGEAA
jgi:hypothetical protein